jgi:hypothetical protein
MIMKCVLRKTAVCLGLLLSCVTVEAIPPVVFTSPVLKLVDAFVNIREIFEFAKNVICLIHGAKGIAQAQQLAKQFELVLPQPLKERADGTVPLIFYEGEYWNLKELAEIERSGKAAPAALQLALEHACGHFETFSAGYVEEIQVAKVYMVQLIEQWSELRNRPETILLNWSKMDHNEVDAIYSTVTSFPVFDSLLGDLLVFLADLVQNCPRAHKAYRMSLKNSGTAAE